MKERPARRFGQAWAFAALLLLPNYIDLTSSDGCMNSPVALSKVALAHLTAMLIVGLLFAGAMAVLRRAPGWRQIRWVMMVLLPVMLLARNRDVIPFYIPGSAVAALTAAWTSVLVYLILRRPGVAAQLSRLGGSVLTGFVVFAAVMSAQLVRTALWRSPAHAFERAIVAGKPIAASGRPRLVWIVFDELAYRPVFEVRDGGLHLPNFDWLRGESTLYTDVTPVAYKTIRVIPSLLLGHAVTGNHYAAGDKYLVQTADDPQWEPFDAKGSLFGMAARQGVSTSIVGWYVPYCPIFAGIVDQCYWSNEDAQDRGPTSTGASFGENVWFPLRIMAERAVMPHRAWKDVTEWNAASHAASVRDIERHELETMASSEADILYIHLPVPHPPAFWNRHTQSFAAGGSYLDSLDYADRLLGRMLKVLESQPRWGATTLIVQGDHSWRTSMWRPQPGWSSEDERISSGGEWDPRPVLMIHARGQSAGATVTAKTSLLVVHDVVAKEIQGFAK